MKERGKRKKYEETNNYEGKGKEGFHTGNYFPTSSPVSVALGTK